MTKEKIKRPDAVKDYINEELSNPFSCEVKVKEEGRNLLIDCGCWVLTMGVEDDYFNVETRRGWGIGEYDLDQIVEIRDNKETIMEIYNGEEEEYEEE